MTSNTMAEFHCVHSNGATAIHLFSSSKFSYKKFLLKIIFVQIERKFFTSQVYYSVYTLYNYIGENNFVKIIFMRFCEQKYFYNKNKANYDIYPK